MDIDQNPDKGGDAEGCGWGGGRSPVSKSAPLPIVSFCVTRGSGNRGKHTEIRQCKPTTD